MMNFLVLAAIFSAIGMIAVFGRRLSEARKIGEGELLKRLSRGNSVFGDFQNFISALLGKYWQAKIIPIFYKKRENCILLFRMIVAKLSKILLKFDDYLHGKSRIKMNNGNGGGYWNDINEFKNGLNGDGSK